VVDLGKLKKATKYILMDLQTKDISRITFTMEQNWNIEMEEIKKNVIDNFITKEKSINNEKNLVFLNFLKELKKKVGNGSIYPLNYSRLTGIGKLGIKIVASRNEVVAKFVVIFDGNTKIEMLDERSIVFKRPFKLIEIYTGHYYKTPQELYNYLKNDINELLTVLNIIVSYNMAIGRLILPAMKTSSTMFIKNKKSTVFTYFTDLKSMNIYVSLIKNTPTLSNLLKDRTFVSPEYCVIVVNNITQEVFEKYVKKIPAIQRAFLRYLR